MQMISNIICIVKMTGYDSHSSDFRFMN